MGAKQDLRTRLLARRRRLPADVAAAASRRACARLSALPEWRRARTVAVYAAARGELDPGPLRDAVGGHRLAYPVVEPGRALLRFFAVASEADLVPGAFGIPAPDPARAAPVALEDIDLFVVPGVAFDASGRRLGLGKGFYDRLLPLARPGAARLGFGYEWQLVPEVPVEPWDVPLDGVVTDARVVWPPEVPVGGAGSP